MMKGKGLFQKHRNPADEASFETFLRQSLRTPGHQTQSREQLEQRALLAKDAARETLLNQAAVAAASAPSTRSFSGRFSFRPRRLAAVVSAAVVLLAAGIGMPASGEYRINLQIEQREDGSIFISPDNSDNQDPNSSNRIFSNISEQLNCPRLSLYPYVSSIYCIQNYVQTIEKYALVALSVNNTIFNFNFECVDSNYSQTISDAFRYIDSIPIDEANNFIVYQSTDANSGYPYVCYLIYNNCVISISANTEYNTFIELIQHLSVTFEH